MKLIGEFFSLCETKSPSALLLAALALAFFAAATQAAAPKTSATEIEGEVMCPICGTLLELSDSPQARREKAYVAKLVAAGKSKAEIKDALVAQYGRSVLAQPKASGFDLTAYLVPLIAIVVAIVLLTFSVLRWRRAGSHPDDPTAGAPPRGADAERLEADLSRYDL
jgi:cytochrome c-type biogenesis protein CcmH/NrfF